MSKTLVKLTAIYHRQNPLRLDVNYVVSKLHYYHSHVKVVCYMTNTA